MLSWDEVDNEDTGAAVVKGANAGHASEANMDRLDGAGAAAAVEARAVTANDSAAIIRAKSCPGQTRRRRRPRRTRRRLRPRRR